MRNVLVIKNGQSLIEVVVGLAVMMIVVLSLVTVTTVSIRNASFSRNQMLATKYAQEGIEKVRAFRDQNTWPVFTAACDAGTISLGTPPSPFSLSFQCAGSGDTREIIVKVEWSDTQGTHKSELKTQLTNWR